MNLEHETISGWVALGWSLVIGIGVISFLRIVTNVIAIIDQRCDKLEEKARRANRSPQEDDDAVQDVAVIKPV